MTNIDQCREAARSEFEKRKDIDRMIVDFNLIFDASTRRYKSKDRPYSQAADTTSQLLEFYCYGFIARAAVPIALPEKASALAERHSCCAASFNDAIIACEHALERQGFTVKELP
jgi:hypothetical protein